MIDLIVRPGETTMWSSFVDLSFPYGIALDGYVYGGPQFDPKGPRANFNHHEDVDRLATRATCAQVLMAIRQGLFQRFRDSGGPRATLYVNDCDEDVSTSVFLLQNYHLAAGAMNPLLNRLVAMEDALDCTAGAYPFPADLPALKELAWVFEPYREFRGAGGLEKRSESAYRSVITDVCGRIGQHITGRGSSIPLDTRYERLGGNANYAVVKEIGAHARTGMFSDGIRAYVSIRERQDGRWQYVIGRMSPFVFTDTLLLAKKLNGHELAERDSSDQVDLWGGGNTIIGSPRIGGSRIPPARLLDIIDLFLV